MIGMHVGYENRGDFFPSQIQPSNGYLRSFASVEKKEFSLSPNEDTGEMTVGQRHHASAAKDECF
jgi:hypothetical protein